MPELPDLTVYAESIMVHFGAQRLSGLRVASPFVLRTFDPQAQEVLGRKLEGVSLVGKRLVFVFEGGLSAVIYLMIAGRFSHQELGKQIPAKVGLLALRQTLHRLRHHRSTDPLRR